MSRLMQWVVLDLQVFRHEWANNPAALTFGDRSNQDGTHLKWFLIPSFPPSLVVGASANLVPLLDPQHGIPYIERDHAPPDEVEMNRRLFRDRALRVWHTSAIKQPFETWFAQLKPGDLA